MSRTGRRMDVDSIGFADGEIFIPALISNVAGSFVAANNVLTKNASGNVSLNIPASTTATLLFPLSQFIQRYGLNDDFQQQFGNAQGLGANAQPVGSPFTLATASTVAGSNIQVAVLSSVGFTVGQACLIDTGGPQEIGIINAIPNATTIQFLTLKNAHTFTSANATFAIAGNTFSTPADSQGVPPLTGTIDITPQVTPRVKGILFRQIMPVYSIATLALTTNTIGLTKTVLQNGVAPLVTNLLANAANGLATAVGAQPYNTPIQIPLANQVFQNGRFSEYIVEWDIVTPATSTCNVYGFFVDFTYNYN